MEILFTALGCGCQTVARTSNELTDFCVGTWSDGRVGSFRGSRNSEGYGATAFTAGAAPLQLGLDGGGATGAGLLPEILAMFHGGPPPVDPAETLEIYAFMAASETSKERGGAPVSIAETVAEAAEQAQQLVDLHWHTPSTLEAARAAGRRDGNAPGVAAFAEACRRAYQ